MSLGLRIGIVVALQTLALLGMVAMKQYTLSTGTPVLLKTEPFDPRSLFSGDYVRLNYAINRLEIKQLGGDKAFGRGDAVYVVLKPGNEYWEPESVHRDYPPPGAGQKVIKGKVEYVNERWQSNDNTTATPERIGVKYGIENYFVPEGEGHALERPKPGETVSIRVVVDKYGNPAIQAVLVNGMERYVERVL